MPSGIQGHESAHRETQRHLHRCRDTQATTPGPPSVRSAAPTLPGHAVSAPLRCPATRPWRRRRRRDGRGVSPASGCAVGDPRNLGVSPDQPGSAVSGQPDRQPGRRRRRFGIQTWPGQRCRARFLSSHAASLKRAGARGSRTRRQTSAIGVRLPRAVRHRRASQ